MRSDAVATGLAEFEWLLLHARLLPDLQLALMAQEIESLPREPLSPDAVAAFAAAQPTDDELLHVPGAETDWFGTGGLDDAEVARLIEAGERELAAGAARMAETPATAVAADAPVEDDLDLARELAHAYAQRDAAAALAPAALERISQARLQALLAGVGGGFAPLTGPLSVDALAQWLQRMQDGDAALSALLDAVLDAAEPR